MEETTRDQEEMERQEEDLTRLLPADVFAEVLRRLPHRGLAVSRCVCKAWRSAIDARRLMLRHLLPHSLGGIYLRFCGFFYTLQFLARPTADDDRKIPTSFSYGLPPASNPFSSDYPYGNSFDHCNGLLLLDDAVVNPATGKWANLPPHPSLLTESDDFYDDFYKDKYLVFDPTVSMHFEVISMDRLLDGPDPAIQASEWPPSPYMMHVFSSRSWQWEERSFLREGEAAGTLADMRPLCPFIRKGYAVLWKGELYVQCESNFVMRISLSSRKYRVIKPPIEIKTGIFLGKSEKGVYCALLDYLDNRCQLLVWLLNEELGGQMEWVLKHQTHLQLLLLMRQKINKQTEGPWILQDTNYYQPRNVNGNQETMANTHHGFISFLGFHPYKEVVFLTHSMRRVLTYDLSSSKVGDLGYIHPRSYPLGHRGWVKECFPYTPCWVEGFPLQT